jgi:quercetin dioxygenase-like cupin family protein
MITCAKPYLLAATVIMGAVAVTAGHHASAGTKKEVYESKAQKTELLKDPLAAFGGLEANVIRFDLPPGFVGERHYHTGDVFVYIEKGSFTVEVEGQTRTFGAGEVYHEAVNVPMQARNGSTTEETTIVVFQVGKTGEPMMMKAD